MKESNHTIDKKVQKLLALLLASSMALMNVAPAYGTDIFTDPDNAANEDVISVPEDMMILRVARKQIEMLNENVFNSRWACSVYNFAKHMKL